jgi:hypothetical protein
MSRRVDHPATSADGQEVWTTSWKDTARHWLGRTCLPWLPSSYLARFLDDYYIDQEPKSFFKRAIRDELTRIYYAGQDAEIRALNRRSLWGSTAGVRWHEAVRRKHEERPGFLADYLNTRNRMLGQIDWLLGHFPFFKDVCEIGTGNGLFIDHLAGRLTQIERFRGIDLSAEQIAKNRAIFDGSKVEYLHVEATEYVLRHCRPGTLFVTCGTFECFAQAELEEFLALTRRAVDRVAFVICDAVDVDYDLEVELNSRPRGNLFFNHNYRHLLEKHGYEICFNQIEFPKPIYKRVSILGTTFPCGQISTHNQTSH